ncbi:hypothetical protein Athai_00770 [Actinocatenispora thailandica]|uniref:DUF1211 domain-containing protein n=1 Tax=Actinocatenispora thailandica TaxID=227318 RepID=A0A7R7DJ36_9ACTN|nr:TMEM175 family protein [Actinocatenispora thailandica]BCJ32574.1 hypothetical protein Athai_00770 [Actinocatenispora thailandica]
MLDEAQSRSGSPGAPETADPAGPAADSATGVADAATRAEAEEIRLTRVEVEFAAAERLTFFSDAVVAIAITLLALELPVPHRGTSAEVLSWMLDRKMDYIAFFISFAVIGAHWMSHHAVFRWIRRLGGRVLRFNMIWLMIIVLLPYLTKLLTESDDDGAFIVRFGLYALAQAVSGVLFLLMVRDMWAYGLFRPGAPAKSIDGAQMRSLVMAGMFAISIPVALLGSWSYLVWIAMPVPLRVLGGRLRGWLGAHRPSSPTPETNVM